VADPGRSRRLADDLAVRGRVPVAFEARPGRRDADPERLQRPHRGQVGAIGPAELSVEMIRDLVAAGADEVMCRFIAFDWQEQFAILARDILPHVAKMGDLPHAAEGGENAS
jgi:hypothetical protein